MPLHLNLSVFDRDHLVVIARPLSPSPLFFALQRYPLSLSFKSLAEISHDDQRPEES